MNFFIPEFRVAGLFARLEKLNRRATKLNLPLITYKETGNEEFRKTDKITIIDNVEHNMGEIFTLFKEVEVCGEEPKIPGYEFLCAIEHIEEGNIVSSHPENTFDLSKYRVCPPKCDHCKHDRKRNKTYILFNRAGEKQVGSTCIKDFLGGNGDPEKMLELAADLWALVTEYKDSDYDFEGGGGGKHYLELSRFLGCVVQLTKKFGFISRKTATERMTSSTADLALNLYYSKEPDWQIDYKNVNLAVEYLEKGRTALEALAERNDFEHNLYVVTKREFLDPKHVGIAAYFIEWLNKKDRIQQDKQSICNEHFGTVGERQEFNLKFLGSHTFESIYGTTCILRFEDEQRRSFVWKTSGGTDWDFSNSDKNTIHKIKGTIKKHTEYKERKQTELSRCKILKTESLDKLSLI